MDVHKNARLTPKGRGEMVRRVLAGERVSAVAAAFGTTVKTVAKWVGRYRREGSAGLEDRSSRPRRLRKATPAEVVEKIIALRRQRPAPNEAPLVHANPRHCGCTRRYTRALKLRRRN